MDMYVNPIKCAEMAIYFQLNAIIQSTYGGWPKRVSSFKKGVMTLDTYFSNTSFKITTSDQYHCHQSYQPSDKIGPTRCKYHILPRIVLILFAMVLELSNDTNS